MLGLSRLNRFTKRLQNASDYDELLDLIVREVTAVGYSHAWLLTPEDSMNLMRIWSLEANPIQRAHPVLDITGDLIIAELLLKSDPVIIPDVRLDTRTNNEAVRSLGLTTLITVPVHLADESLGILCVGTFGFEGVRLPSEVTIEYLMVMGSQIGGVIDRFRLKESKRLTNLKMGKIQKMENLGLLASSVVHEFNNMLQIVSISISSAMRYCSAESARDLEIALESLVRTREISRDLLSLGRVEDTMMPLCVRAIIVGLVSKLKHFFPSQVQIRVIGQEELPQIMGNAEQLTQVFLNLIINAKDAMRPTGGEIEFRTAIVGDEILVSVTDTGVGIPEEVRDHMFEPFFSTKHHQNGSGLGLAVVLGMVERHNGRIECLSEVGVGTMFNLYFPVPLPNDEDPAGE